MTQAQSARPKNRAEKMGIFKHSFEFSNNIKHRNGSTIKYLLTESRSGRTDLSVHARSVRNDLEPNIFRAALPLSR